MEKHSNNTVEVHITHFGGERRVTVIILENGYVRVLVLDNQKQPLMPCTSARARQLLRDGKAAVFRRYPFTIILKDRVGGDTQPLSLNVDPGSKN